MGQPVRQASVLACEGSLCHPVEERKKEGIYSVYLADYAFEMTLSLTIKQHSLMSVKQKLTGNINE